MATTPHKTCVFCWCEVHLAVDQYLVTHDSIIMYTFLFSSMCQACESDTAVFDEWVCRRAQEWGFGSWMVLLNRHMLLPRVWVNGYWCITVRLHHLFCWQHHCILVIFCLFIICYLQDEVNCVTINTIKHSTNPESSFMSFCFTVWELVTHANVSGNCVFWSQPLART